MTVDFKLPHLGENINTADVVKVLVKEGDRVEIDQVILEIETDKATVEVPSEIAGIVKKVHVKEGDKAIVGQPVITIEQSESVDSRAQTEKPSQAEEKIQQPQENISKVESTSNIVDFKVPVLGENIEVAQIARVLVKAGDNVEVDQILMELETDKATVEVPSEYAGVIKEVKVKEGDKVKVGQTAFLIETKSTSAIKKEIPETKPSIKTEKEVEKPQPVKEHTHMPQVIDIPRDIVKNIVPAAPSVRRFAREIGIDIHQVEGSGKGGRITIEDVKAFAKSLNQKIQSGQISASGLMQEPLPDFSKWGQIERVQMNNVRKKTAEHLSYAWSTIPHVTQFDKADITNLEKLRKEYSKKVEAAGGKLTVTAILIKIVASALKVFPQFNASVDMQKSEIIYKKYFNIGVAVDTDKGLLVPVIKDVDKKNIVDISVELAEISQKARDKKLSLEEMQGGNFTISNLGGIGGTYFTPIVNSPEVAILGVSRSSYEPVYIDGKFEPRLIMPLSLSYDHRVIDGADGIRFLRWIVEALENPFLLILEG
ncbi:dihydrolipoyllysine-residue acetyltransferase [Melioribacter sp. OK-6-Me]|uniref:dihydrolipoyllysine-residue acetyltransferase n=1 Tax=unclassified Melioribacter TaxID=2627329 RepID=UPI003ED9659E